MFVVTFSIGIKTILSTVKPQYNQQEITQDMQNETISQNTIRDDESSYNSITQEQSKNSSNTLDNAILQDIYEKENNTIYNETEQNETNQEAVNSNTTNNTYIGTGFIGISILFLIISIIFFIKYQLKNRKKLSK